MHKGKAVIWIIILALVIVVGGVVYTFSQQRLPVPLHPATPQAFGTLPALSSAGITTGAQLEAPKSPPAGGTAPTMGSTPATDMSQGIPAPTAIARPEMYPCYAYPCPSYQPTKVVYKWKGDTVPSEPAQVTVYRSTESTVSADSFSWLAGSAGKLLSGATVTNFAATDADGYTWNVDANSRSWNFWQNFPVMYAQPMTGGGAAVSGSAGSGTVSSGSATAPSYLGPPIRIEPPAPAPKLSDDEIISIARTFFSKRGIVLDSFGTPAVEHYPFAGNDQIQFNVYVPYVLNGTPVVNWGGEPAHLMQVTVDITLRAVTSGSGIIDGAYDASSYPSVKTDDALKQILGGGMNPYNGYNYPIPYAAAEFAPAATTRPGSKLPPLPGLPQTITVSWGKAELAYLFYQSYEQNRQVVYLIPIYLFHGSIPTGGGGLQFWSSWVPAIPADFFGNGAGSGGGYAVPLEGDVKPTSGLPVQGSPGGPVNGPVQNY
jgi:hypothetical protein